MAGITLPAIFLLVVLTVFSIVRFVCGVEFPIERVIVFPMAVVPNLWGLWNILYIRLCRGRIPIGLHGALLPLLLFPIAYLLTKALRIENFPPPGVWLLLPVGIVVYYLIFKYFVAYLNKVLEIA